MIRPTFLLTQSGLANSYFSLMKTAWQFVRRGKSNMLIIFLLNEPASSMDPKTKTLMYEKLFEECKGKAIVSTLYRLHLISYFDHIYISWNLE